jgi:hypothetical protein
MLIYCYTATITTICITITINYLFYTNCDAKKTRCSLLIATSCLNEKGNVMNK